MTDVEKLPIVANVDKMPEDTFIKHMNARHMPMAGLRRLSPANALVGLRAYHARVHELGVEDDGDRPVNHTHNTGK